MTRQHHDERPHTVRRASAADTLRTAVTVLLPALTRGPAHRRSAAGTLATRLDTDRRALRELRRLRARYGPGPLRLRLPRRSVALLLCSDDAQRMLTGTPDPYAPAAPGAHALPPGLLRGAPVVAQGPQQRRERRFTDAVLQTDRLLHELAPVLVRTVRQEAASIAVIASTTGHLTWYEFETAWWRTVRRVVLGDRARDDQELTRLLTRLHGPGLLRPPGPARPGRGRARAQLLRRLRGCLEAAEPDSLAGRITATPGPAGTRPEDRLARWLPAFDDAGATVFRTLALLATHPAQAATARREIGAPHPTSPRELPHLRACVLDTLRLWPTTPLLLRRTTETTHWDQATTLPPGTTLALHTPLLHRDAGTVPWADRFTPERWPAHGGAPDDPAPMPFGIGPGGCPGRNLVLLTATTLLAALLRGHRFTLRPPPLLTPDRPLPHALAPSALRFTVVAGG